MKLITLFLLLLPLNIVAQDLCVTYECYVLKMEDNSGAKIYHAEYKVTITDTSIMVTMFPEGVETLIFEVPTLTWSVGVNYMESNYEKINVKFYPRLKNLVITNMETLIETTFYGTIPTLIEIKK